MLREKMDLRIKILVLPLTEFVFYEKTYAKSGKGQPLDLLEQSNFFHQEKKLHRPYEEDALIRTIIKTLNATTKINNLDEIKLLVQKYYGYEILHEHYGIRGNMTSFYLSHLRQLSSFFLTHRNGKIAIKYWESEKERPFLGPYSGINKLAMWNSMERMFTTEILVMLYFIDNGMNEDYYLRGYHGTVQLADTQLDQVLSRGVAENHMHLNLGGTFYFIWRRFMSEPNGLKEGAQSQNLEGYTIFKEYPTLVPYIQAMALVRILLAQFLSQLNEFSSEDLSDYYSRNYNTFHDSNDSTVDFLTNIRDGSKLEEKDSLRLNRWMELLKDQLNLVNGQETRGMSWRKKLAKSDAIHLIIEGAGEYNTVENLFLFRSLKYMDKHEADDLFCQVFWQYIRIKNETFQFYAKTNHIHGLDHFMEYSRRKPGAKNKDWGLTLHHLFENQHLSKLEVRVTPQLEDNKLSSMARDIQKLLKLYKELLEEMLENTPEEQVCKVPELGIVFHFIKKEDDINKCWLGFKPEIGNTDYQIVGLEKTIPTNLYYRKLQETYAKQMEALHALREGIPGLADYIVGIDAAGPEYATEPWVFSTIYRKARDSKTHKLIYKDNKNKTIRNLGFTYHVGEDFRHVTSGLRRIQEVIEHFQFHSGDRIGHGIVLGVDIESWIHRNPVVILPRIEHLENLLWIWGIHKKGTLSELDSSFLEQQIMKLAEQIYIKIEGITVYSLWKAYQSKFQAFEVSDNYEQKPESNEKENILFCPYIKTDNWWNESKLIHAQHCKCYLVRMVEPIQIAVHVEEKEFLSKLQKNMREQISREGIVVETNPTSNTSIGEIDDLFKHYINTLNKRKLSEVPTVDNGMMVTINSDDPFIFNTNISNEYAYMFYSLLEKKYARADALEWIDQIRKMGIQSSFIETRIRTKRELFDELDSIINDLEDKKKFSNWGLKNLNIIK
jgi:adenosine deaminase